MQAVRWLMLSAVLGSGAGAETPAKCPSADWSGALKGFEMKTFTLAGKKGQTVELTLTSTRINWLVLRLFPAQKTEGTDVVSNYINGEAKLRGVLPEDGNYTVMVGIRRPEARRGGAAAFKLHLACH